MRGPFPLAVSYSCNFVGALTWLGAGALEFLQGAGYSVGQPPRRVSRRGARASAGGPGGHGGQSAGTEPALALPGWGLPPQGHAGRQCGDKNKGPLDARERVLTAEISGSLVSGFHASLFCARARPVRTQGLCTRCSAAPVLSPEANMASSSLSVQVAAQCPPRRGLSPTSLLHRPIPASCLFPLMTLTTTF